MGALLTDYLTGIGYAAGAYAEIQYLGDSITNEDKALISFEYQHGNAGN
jgi:hypothetical protein